MISLSKPVNVNPLVRLSSTAFALALLLVMWMAQVQADDIKFKRFDIAGKRVKDHGLIKRFPGAVIFDYQKHSWKTHDLMMGAMSYIASEDPELEGYRPARFKPVTGHITRIVYDYDESTTVDAVFRSVEQTLTQKGFQQDFRCHALLCGDIDGWQTYLYPQIGASGDNQQYLVTSRNGTIVSFYVNKLAGQARGVLDIIENTQDGIVEKFTDNQAMIQLFFAPGEFIPTADLLEEMSQSIRQNIKEDTRLYIKGFADISGTPAFNLQLSQKRADYIKRVIIDKTNLLPEQIRAEGLGAVSHFGNSKVNSVNAKDRRVDIIFHPASS